MTCTRRHLFALAMLAGCARRPERTGCAALHGETVRCIVPYAPGGTTDFYGRLLEPPLERALGAEIVVVNEEGAGSLIGAMALRDARPDGRTIGVLNAAALLVTVDQERSVSPGRDYAVLARLAPSATVMVTGSRSSIRSVEDLLTLHEQRPLVCGLTGAASTNMLASVATASLLGLRMDHLAGFGNARGQLLAVMRGDVDLITGNYEGLRPSVESGDLRALLQITERPMPGQPWLNEVACLGGPDGWAARRAAATGRTVAAALTEAHMLEELTGAGVVAVAPRNLPVDTLACLRQAVHAALDTPALRAAADQAQRSVSPLPGEDAQRKLVAIEGYARAFAPLVQAAIERSRR